MKGLGRTAHTVCPSVTTHRKVISVQATHVETQRDLSNQMYSQKMSIPTVKIDGVRNVVE